MKNGIQSIKVRTVTAVKVAAIVVAMSFTIPAFAGTSVASAQAKGIPEWTVWVGPWKLCLWFCLTPGFCCEVEGQL